MKHCLICLGLFLSSMAFATDPQLPILPPHYNWLHGNTAGFTHDFVDYKCTATWPSGGSYVSASLQLGETYQTVLAPNLYFELFFRKVPKFSNDGFISATIIEVRQDKSTEVLAMKIEQVPNFENLTFENLSHGPWNRTNPADIQLSFASPHGLINISCSFDSKKE